MKNTTFYFAGNRVNVYKSSLGHGLWAVTFNNSHLWMLFYPATLERVLWEFMNQGTGARKVYRQLELKRGTTIDQDKFDVLVEAIAGSIKRLS